MPNSTSTDAPLVVTITPAQKAAILAKIAEYKALLTFVIGLDNKQRQTLFKLGEKRVGWDEKAANYMATRPDLVPGYVDMNALANNRAVRVDLGDLIRAHDDAGQGLMDTDMVIGSQILKPEHAFYQSAQEAAKHGVPGAQAIADDLGASFVGRKTAATTPSTPTTPPTTTPGT